jgi:hypothetical protein
MESHFSAVLRADGKGCEHLIMAEICGVLDMESEYISLRLGFLTVKSRE